MKWLQRLKANVIDELSRPLAAFEHQQTFRVSCPKLAGPAFVNADRTRNIVRKVQLAICITIKNREGGAIALAGEYAAAGTKRDRMDRRFAHGERPPMRDALRCAANQRAPERHRKLKSPAHAAILHTKRLGTEQITHCQHQVLRGSFHSAFIKSSRRS